MHTNMTPLQKIPQFGIGTFKLFQGNMHSILKYAVMKHLASMQMLHKAQGMNGVMENDGEECTHKLVQSEVQINSSINSSKDSSLKSSMIVNSSSPLSSCGYLLPYPSKLHIDTAWIYKNESFIGQILLEISKTLDERKFQLPLQTEPSKSGSEIQSSTKESNTFTSSDDPKQKEPQVLNPLLREQLFIVSKLPPRLMRSPKDTVRKTVLESLQALNIDYFDLYLIHWPARDKAMPTDSIHKEVRREAWKELEKLYNEGKIKQIGVSNYEIRHLEEMKEYAQVKPLTNQFEVHPYFQQNDLRQYCRDNDIIITAYSPLGCSNGVERLIQDETIVKIAREVGKSPAQVILRWHLQNGHVFIPRTTKVERLEENRNIFDFELSQDQMESINSIEYQERMCWDPSKIL